VDGLAASIASVIAMAGDRIVMAPNSQLMIHDGSGLCIGNAAEMRQMAELLDRQSNNIAEVYANRAGGTAEDWRALMEAETWYTAQEAVDAGLADEVASTRTLTDGNSPQNSWDLSIFRYPSRAEAPAPQPVASAVECQPQPVAPPAVEPEPEAPAAEPVDEQPTEDDTEPTAQQPEAEVETAAPELTPEPVLPPDPWAAATAHLYSTPSTDDVFTRLTEALR
jgi:ClpP class serine protease